MQFLFLLLCFYSLRCQRIQSFQLKTSSFCYIRILSTGRRSRRRLSCLALWMSGYPRSVNETGSQQRQSRTSKSLQSKNVMRTFKHGFILMLHRWEDKMFSLLYKWEGWAHMHKNCSHRFDSFPSLKVINSNRRNHIFGEVLQSIKI